MAGAFAVCALSYLGMGSVGSIELVCLFSLVGGIANGIEVYATMTAIQELTSEELQARVGGLLESIVSGATGAGFLLGGALATFASARSVYLASGFGILLLTTLAFAPRRVISRARARLPATAQGSGRAPLPYPPRPHP